MNLAMKIQINLYLNMLIYAEINRYIYIILQATCQCCPTCNSRSYF